MSKAEKKIIAINGSPRKHGNTATLLEKALEGAEVTGAKTKLIHLYKYTYQGCVSCFACKKKNKKYWGRCAMKDELTPVLEKAMQADKLIIGTPVYLNNISGMLQAFLERLIFPCISYNEGYPSQFDGIIDTAMIYTMNMPQKAISLSGFDKLITTQRENLRFLNGTTEELIVADTWQFKNYEKYEASAFNLKQKATIREEQFPLDIKRAYEIGMKEKQLVK